MESSSVAPVRIRWGWIAGCVALGLGAIATGALLVAPVARVGYLAGVLGGIGTSLLLVGVVVLLERRIVTSAARVVRGAVDAERLASERRMHRLVDELTERLTTEWSTADADDVATMKRRTAAMTDETVDRIVDESTRAAEAEAQAQARRAATGPDGEPPAPR